MKLACPFIRCPSVEQEMFEVLRQNGSGTGDKWWCDASGVQIDPRRTGEQLPSSSWVWKDNWRLDFSGGSVHATEGWESSSSGRFASASAMRAALRKYSAHDRYRRRRWVRTRVRTGGGGGGAGGAGGAGGGGGGSASGAGAGAGSGVTPSPELKKRMSLGSAAAVGGASREEGRVCMFQIDQSRGRSNGASSSASASKPEDLSQLCVKVRQGPIFPSIKCEIQLQLE